MHHSSKKVLIVFAAFLFFSTAHSASANTITTWTSPVSGALYPSGQAIPVSGTWIINIFLPSVIEYVLDNNTSAPTVCQSGNTGTAGSFSCSIASLSAGTHTIYPIAAGTDGNGNAIAESYSASARTFTVSAPLPPTATVTTSPTTGVSGDSFMVTWSSTNADSCILNAYNVAGGMGLPFGWTAQPFPNLSGSAAAGQKPIGTRKYEYTCTGPGGTATATAFHTVPDPAVPAPAAAASTQTTAPATAAVTAPAPVQTAPVVTLSASANPYIPGQPDTISWSATGADRCVWVGGPFSDTPAFKGSSSIVLTGETHLMLRCWGGAFMTDQYLTVLPPSSTPPRLSFLLNNYAGRVVMPSGSSGTLSWTVSGAVSCTTSGDWNININPSGTSFDSKYSTGPITSPKTYTLSCTGPGGTESQSIVVAVSAPIAPLDPACTNVTGSLTQGLSYGATGTEVQLLQCKLINKYYLAMGNALSVFGPKTLDAVQKFQCAQSIVCAGGDGYGIVGPRTRAVLNLLTQ